MAQVSETPRTLRLGVLIGCSLLAIVAALLAPAIPQDPHYHQFADQRRLLGIPHFWNVVSNLAFLPVGLAGVWLLRARVPAGGLAGLRPAYLLFFVGVLGVAFGSGYYHLAPGNATLVWDRLPITVSFMALFAAILGENVDRRAGLRLLGPLIAVGLYSVGYWYLTERAGRGDLRLYALVQFLPVLLIPLVLWMFPCPFVSNRWLWLALLGYVAAKLGETFDAALYAATGMGGHALKHVLAALGALAFLIALRRRRPVESA